MNKIFSKRLSDLIEEKNINKNTLAKKLEISYQQLNHYLNNQSYPSAKRLILLANYLNISLDYLLGLSNSKTNESDIVNKFLEEEVNLKLVNLILKLNKEEKEKLKDFLESITN